MMQLQHCRQKPSSGGQTCSLDRTCILRIGRRKCREAFPKTNILGINIWKQNFRPIPINSRIDLLPKRIRKVMGLLSSSSSSFFILCSSYLSLLISCYFFIILSDQGHSMRYLCIYYLLSCRTTLPMKFHLNHEKVIMHIIL